MISAQVGWSASRNDPSVSSENTTPQPNVASGALRSWTTISWRGSAFLASSAKYRPAGPAPMTSILTAVLRPGRQHVGQAVELLEIGDGRQEHELVAPRLLVAAAQVDDRLRAS